MFGLMQADTNCSTDGNYPNQRYHYCGTCKVIGHEFGQSARAMLNYDAVFLAELLSGLAEDSTENWNSALQAVNQCWVLPGKKAENPLALQYAAAANLLFAELKIKDNISDRGRGWRIVQRFYKTAFRKAIDKLAQWGLDTDACYHWAEGQQAREEAAVSSFDSFESYLDYCAEPTAQLSSLVFKTASNAIHKPELESKLAEFGYAFGRMMYTLDALEDVEKDQRKGQFNPLLSWYKTVGEAEKSMMTAMLEDCRQLVEATLLSLPLSEEKKEVYAVRLQTNIAKRQYQWEATPDPSFRERMQARWAYAQEATERVICTPTSPLGRLQYNMLLLAVFVSPQAVGKGGSFSFQSFLLGFLSLMGLGLLWKGIVPKKEPRKRKRNKAKKIFKQKGCGPHNNAEQVFKFLIVLLIAIEVGLIALGIYLLIIGFIFWGIFTMLILPLLCGLAVLIFLATLC